MKLKSVLLTALILATCWFSNVGQAQNLDLNPYVVYDSSGIPSHHKSNIIITFPPQLVSNSVINNLELDSGKVSDFLNPVVRLFNGQFIV